MNKNKTLAMIIVLTSFTSFAQEPVLAVQDPCQTADHPAGYIWNNTHAQTVCPTVCTKLAGTWTGNWVTPAETWGKSSVCACKICPAMPAK